MEWRGKRFPVACLQTVLFCSCLTKDKTSITVSQRLVLYYRGKKKKNISRACSYIGIKHHGPPGHSRQKLRGHAQFLPFSQTSPSRDTHGIHQQPLLTPPLTHLLHPCISLHPRTSSLACPTSTASRSGLPRLLLHLPPVYSPKVPL